MENGGRAEIPHLSPAQRRLSPFGLTAKVNEPMHDHAMPNIDRLPGSPLRELPPAEPVRDDFVETVKTSSEPEMARQRASEWLRTPRISHEVGLYSKLGGAEVGSALRRKKARGDIRRRRRGLQPPDGA